jgi:outer membrane protein OmpA-like peptidoglycan-associated protein
MIHARGLVVPMLIAAGLVTACGPFRSRSPQRPGQETVVLLPEPDGTVGRAEVSTPAGTVELATARAMTRIQPGEAPQPATEISQDEIDRLFGDALDAQPPAPVHFTLNFRFDSEELTDESRALVDQVLMTVKSHPVPRITVVGHTDTTGSPASNVELGLRRANVVRTLLIDTGLDGSAIDVTSHGEATLLVPTADEVFEPKNRRVDITVR